jgi:6-phosphogluconolactonase
VPALSDFDNGAVLAFSIDGSSGNLTPVNGGPFTTGEIPLGASVNQAGTLLYVANAGSSDVSGFSITASTGALTPITGSPYSTGASEDARTATIDPSGAFVFVPNEATQDVTVFGVNGTTGALAPISGSPFMSGGNGPIASAMDPSGTFL